MTLAQFLEKLHHEIRNVDVMRTNVEVLSTFWTQEYGGIVSAPVTGVGMDENSGNLFIEINKTEFNK